MSSERVNSSPTKPRRATPGPFSLVKPAFQSRRTLKTFVRCCAAFATTMIPLVARTSGDTMGQTTFSALIAAVMTPQSLAESLIAGPRSTDFSLDPRSSAVFGALIFVGAFAMVPRGRSFLRPTTNRADLKRVNAGLKSIMFRATYVCVYLSLVDPEASQRIWERHKHEGDKSLETAEQRHDLGPDTPRTVNRHEALLRKIKEREVSGSHLASPP
ncbi:hypothetical protein BDZ97DRAFT_1926213 [Flammula alnicola]|nr:hypothetical protein BDZ97DRAFT_1926213 [Flammula alnicola]